MLVVPSSLSGDSRTCAGAPGTCWDGCMAADYFWNASAQCFLIHFLFQVLSVYLQCIPCTPGRHSCFLWGMVPCMLREVGTFFIFTLLLAIPCSALRFSIIEDCVNPLEGGLDESGRSVYSMFHQYILRPVVCRVHSPIIHAAALYNQVCWNHCRWAKKRGPRYFGMSFLLLAVCTSLQ
jgi:hypothetical protein